jgi:hypothetical protein
MSLELLKVISSAGAGAVVVAVAVMFQRHLRQGRRRLEADRSQGRRAFLTTPDRVSVTAA